MITALLADLPLLRRKETASAAAHFVTGVLDQESMENAFASLLKVVQFAPGQRVKTLRGSLHGVIVRILDDGRVAWRPDGASTELIALPESLAPDD